MSNFKNIEKLGLKIWDYKDPHHHFAVDAEELERLLQSAQVVYGFPEAPHFSGWSSMDKFPNKNPSHSALILGITFIKKKTKAEAALEYLQMFVEQKTTWHSQAAWEEAKRILEMKD